MATTFQVSPSARPETRSSDDDDSDSISGSSYIGSDAPERDPETYQRRTEEHLHHEHTNVQSSLPVHAAEEDVGSSGNNESEGIDIEGHPAAQPRAASQEMSRDELQVVPTCAQDLTVGTAAGSSDSVSAESDSTSTASPAPDDSQEPVLNITAEIGTAEVDEIGSLETTSQPSEVISEQPALAGGISETHTDTATETSRTEQARVAPQLDYPTRLEGSPWQGNASTRAEASPRPESRSLLDALDSPGPSNHQRSSPGTGRRGPVIVYGGYRSRPSTRGSPQPPAQAVRSMLLPAQEPPLPARPPTPPPLPRDPVPTPANRPGMEAGNAQAERAEDAGRRPTGASIVLPRWQPDVEATLCPICHTQFGWLNRKHHCRKCGRVVCNSCSPHRITIPHQFIVQPPGIPQIEPSMLSVGSPGGGYTDFSSLGGGERVRLCNPCVPDPNTSPPQPHQSGHRARHSRSQSGFAGAMGIDLRRGPVHLSIPGTQYENGGRSAPVNRGLSPTGSRTISATSPALGLPARQRSIFDIPLPEEPAAGSSSSSSRNRQQNRRSLPPVPRQVSPAPRQHPIAEEDECPVCHLELPSRSLANFEALREIHVANCILAHSTYGASPGAVVSPTGAGPTEGPSSPGAFRPTIRRTGMFPYVATEKDCVDSAECTICLEEFEVGVMMARLECLCRFHRSCITAWFVGHPGRCPVHQHDSFGF